MVSEEMVQSERKYKQMTLDRYTSAVAKSNPKMLVKQTKLTDFFPSKNPERLIIINHTAHNNNCIIGNQEKSMSGDLVSDCYFPMSMKMDFPDSEELIELKQDFTLKMLEICIGKLIEENKPKIPEKKIVKPTRQLNLTDFIQEDIEPIHLEEELFEDVQKIEDKGMTADQILFLICLMIAMIFRGKIDRKKTVGVNRKMVLKTTFRSWFLTPIIAPIPLGHTPYIECYS